MEYARENGGFPIPPASEPVRLLTAHHDACSAETRVRIPRTVPSHAVRRVICERCERPYEPASVVEQPVAAHAGRRPGRDSWRWLTLPLAALAVLAVLNAVRGDEPATTSAPSPAASTGSGEGDRARAERVPKDAQVISESTFQMALPAGWTRTSATGGATFAARAPDGEADVTLWVERDAKLNFAIFEARSLAQLQSLAGSADVVERVPGPTPEASSVRIAPATPPAGAPEYEVLLRASGNYWFYLATTVQPGAGASVSDDVELIQGSFLPQGGAR